MKTLKTWAAAAAMVALSGAAQAALIDRGGGMIYDTTRNLTWLADMNYAKTSGYNSDGLMTWAAAKAWAEGLRYGGYDDWRLPNMDPCTVGLCADSELGGLFVTDLGIKDDESVLNPTGDTAEQIANVALFSNVQSFIYWSGTVLPADPDDPDDPDAPVFARAFATNFGSVGYYSEQWAFYAVAVRPGDVAASVPEPQSLALVLLGLGAGMVARRRRPR